MKIVKKRKVMLVNSSYVLVLPKFWAEINNLSKGDILVLTITEDKIQIEKEKIKDEIQVEKKED